MAGLRHFSRQGWCEQQKVEACATAAASAAQQRPNGVTNICLRPRVSAGADSVSGRWRSELSVRVEPRGDLALVREVLKASMLFFAAGRALDAFDARIRCTGDHVTPNV